MAMRTTMRRAWGGRFGTDHAMAKKLVKQLMPSVWAVGLSCGLPWLVWLYASGLRDPRYLDGWVLAGGMGLQLYFHIRRKRANLTPKSARRWRRIHIIAGYVLITAFLLHTDFSLPDTEFEWLLWTCFTLVALSGMFGTYLAWALKAKRQIDETVGYDRIPARRDELAKDVHTAVFATDPTAAAIPLPALPCDAWIEDLYTNRVGHFFEGQRNITAHLIGSRNPLEQLIGEIDALSPYVDQHGKMKLLAIRSLVIEKDRLDYARVYLAMNRAWLWVHVPITYGLIVLTILHVVIVYAYSASAW